MGNAESRRAHATPANSLRDHASGFISCAMDLIDHCKRDKSDPLPLLIRMPDLSQGSGSAVTLSLLKLINPSHVYFIARGLPRMLENVTEAISAAQLYVIPSLETPTQLRADDEAQDMQTVAEFHHDWTLSGQPSWNPTPVNQQSPICASFAGPRRDFIAVMCLPIPHPEGKLMQLLNTSLVSVVHITDPTVLSDLRVEDEMDSGIPYISGVKGKTALFLDPRKSQLLGIALIRGISREHQHLQLIMSPDLTAKVQQCNGQLVLTHGCLETPKALLLEEQFHKDWTSSTSDTFQLIDDNPSTYGITMDFGACATSFKPQDRPRPYLESHDGSSGSRRGGEARWKSRKFNMGGNG